MAPEAGSLLTRGRVPQAHGLVIASTPRGQRPAVRAEDERGNPVRVAPEGNPFAAGDNVPQLHRAILIGRSQGLAIAREGEDLDPACVSCQRVALAVAGAVVEAPGEVTQVGRTGLGIFEET